MMTAERVRSVRDALLAAMLPTRPAGAVDALAALEELKAAVVAVQAAVALSLDDHTRAGEEDSGTPADRQGCGVPAQVGLAMRVSPHAARAFLGCARIWHTEMPHTLTALRAGRLSEHRATILVQETACLPLEARQAVDVELCADPRVLSGIGTRELTGLVRASAARLDPAAVTERARRAAAERCVSIRPAPDTMAYVTALLPVAQGVAVHAALKQAAATATATGDARSRGQVMADTLVTRVTGQERADGVPITVNLVVSDTTLLGAGHEAAILLDETVTGTHTRVPAQVARELTASALDTGAAWLRQVYATPTGRLTATTSRSRFHTGGLEAMLRIRDQGICRTPWCDAPARHTDHVTPYAAGGVTSLQNGQSLCTACNLAKEAPGWASVPGTDPRTGRHRTTLTTPTGHQYVSVAPPLPRPAVSPGRATGHPAYAVAGTATAPALRAAVLTAAGFRVRAPAP